jgi:thiamine-phosphate diphosphorylase
MTPRIVLVTDPWFADDAIIRCVEQVAEALPSGALCVQLRDKRRLLPSLRMMAIRLRVATRRAGARLVINGQARLARDVGADGVHLGSGAGTVAEARAAMGRPTWISVAAHTDEDVRRAKDEGADAVLVSPIFATRPPTAGGLAVVKPPRLAVVKPPRGVSAIRSARSIAQGMAVFALGGVTLDRVRACAEAGADGIAVLRALLASPRPAALARAMNDSLALRW